MTVQIDLMYIICLIVYAGAVTLLWVCTILGRGKEAQDNIIEIKRLANIEKVMGNEVQRLTMENEQERNNKLLLADKYVNVQNEYAWFRQMVRASDPDAVRIAERKIREQKEACHAHLVK